MLSFDANAFAQRLKDLRQNAGLTQEELADILSVSANYMGKLEMGIRTPSVNTLLKLSLHLHVTLDFLVIGRHTYDMPLEDQALLLATQLTAFAEAKIASNPDNQSQNSDSQSINF